VSFAAISLCVASQRVLIVVIVYFVIDSVRKLLDTLSYTNRYISLLVIITTICMKRRSSVVSTLASCWRGSCSSLCEIFRSFL
jgi:hypothetical protein